MGVNIVGLIELLFAFSGVQPDGRSGVARYLSKT